MKREQKAFNKFRLTLIDYFKELDKPDNHVVMTTEAGRGYTKAELLAELKLDSQVAKDFMFGTLLYAIDLFSRQAEIRQEAVAVEGNGTIN